MINSILLVFPHKFVENTLYLSAKFSKVFDAKLLVFIIQKKGKISQENIENKLKELNVKYEIFVEENGIKGKIEEFYEKHKPDMIIVPHEKIDPMLHIFKHPATEKFAEKFDDCHIIFPVEEARDIKKSLIYVDPDDDTEDFVKNAYEILSRVSSVEFIYAFYEEYYEYSLMKTHPEEEARKILQEMYEEGLEKSRRLIAKAIGKEITLKVIKGDPKKEVPFFATEHNYDLLGINIENENKKSFIENTEISIGLFKG